EVADLVEDLQLPRWGSSEAHAPTTRRPDRPGSRLITLTGPGGSGKTRLAVELIHRMKTGFTGVGFVSLADAEDASRIAPRILEALALPHRPNVEPTEYVAAALSAGPWLLVLDNLEHLAADGAATVQALLERAPELVCLVTSRHRLGLQG